LVANQQYGVITNGSSVITGNVVSGSVNGIVGGGGLGVKHTITNNVSNSNSSDGILLAGGPAGSVVSGNRTLSNLGTGIYSEVPGATFTGNTANGNKNGMNVFSADPTTLPIKASGNKAYFNDELGISVNAWDSDLGNNKAGGNGSA